MKGRTSHKRNKRSICVNLLLSMLLLISSVPLWPSKAANAAAEGAYLLSLNRPVYSSSSLGGNTADHAVDGNKNTRWESVWQQDPQWIYVDLGAVASISNISIEWENAYASAFDLEVSDDEVNWTQVYSTTKGQGGMTEVEVSANARYVRLFSHERAQQAYGVSLYAFNVYGTGGANPPPKPVATNLALGKTVMASSEEIDEPSRSAEDKAKMEKRNYEARNVTDGDPGTRWSSIYKDQEWIVVDLGERHEIGGISLQWENAFGRAYDIQVSNDAKKWTTLFRELHSNGGRDDIPVYAEARYVKFAGLGRGTTNGYSLYAFDVYEYIQGDEQPVYTIPAIPEMSSVQVGAGSYAINDITMLQPKNPKNRTTDITTPIPSNDWWQSILVSDLGDGNSLVTLPFKNRYTKQGLHILNPGAGYLSADGNSMDADGEADLILTTSTMNPAKVNTKVAGYGDYSANIIMSDDDTAKVNTTFVKGSPFLYNTFENPDTILLRSPNITRLFDDQNRDIMLKDGESWTGDHIGIEVTNQDRAPSPQTFTRNYGLYAPEGTTLIKLGNTLKIKLGSNENYLSLATLPSASELAYYYQHAYAFVTDTKVDYNYNESTSQVTTTFSSVTQTKRANFSTSTLMALFPHQWKIATTPLTELTYPSIRGMMKVSEGNSFTTQDRFYGIIPQFVEPDDPTYSRAQLISYLDQLDADTSGNLMSEDPYWQGKKLHPLALGVLISDQLGDHERRDHYLSLLRNILTDWYTYSPDERLHSYYFYYSEQWGTIFPYGSGFGVNTGLTDHHFTYGYYVFASAVLAMYDPTFVEDYGDMVELLIRDYANPSRTDDQFPWMRNFDPYSGHSWAGGYADNRSGNNQEAAGEALFSWVGQYMWGEVTGNKAYRDTGIWGFVTEEKAAEQYWFNYDGDNWLEGYKHATVGHVYGSAYLYGTYFSNDAEHIYGIHWLPPAEWMTYYGRDPKNTAALYNGLIKDLGGQQERTWQHIIWPFQSIGDPEAALAKWNTKDMQQNEVFNAYWFIHSMASTGTRTMDIWADSPAVTVYEKDGVYTAQIWNPSDAAKTVRFYNASGALGSATVYAKAQVKVNPLENTVVKQPDASQGVTYLDRSSWTITASSSSEAVERMIDGDLATRWSSGQTQQPGDWLHIDLGSEQMMDTLFLNSGNNWGDYARGYEVYVSKDNENWSKPIAQGTGTSPSLSVDLGMQTVRYIKIVLTAPADSWWSISELKLARFGKLAQAPEHPNPNPSPLPDRSTWIVTASSTQGTDVTAYMLDGKKETLWTNGRKQTEGQWITIDLGQTSAFDAVELDSGNAKDDYPRQYRIFVSDDGQNWGTSIAGGEGASGRLSISFPEQQARYVKIMQTGESDQWWSISELFVQHYGTGKQKRLLPDAWSVTASSNEEAATAILDGSDQTRWTSGQTQTGGEWIQLDLGDSQIVNRIVLDSAHSSDDYARGYEVFTSLDGMDWGKAVVAGEGQNAVLSIAFAPREARYIKIVQTGTDSHWWSVAEIAVYTADQTPWTPGEQDHLLPTELDRTSWTVTASTSEDVSALLDDDLNSRWTSASAQQPDQWIQIDLGSIQNFSRLTMDSGSSTNDYARSYKVFTSTDGEQWNLVSEALGTDPVISVMFATQQARYVKIALTTDNAKWWWSIAELKLYH